MAILKRWLGLILIVAGALIGAGIGDVISQATVDNMTLASTLIGAGFGLIAAFVYEVIRRSKVNCSK